MVAIGTALLVDMSFHWRDVQIVAPGVRYQTHVTGWHGAGVPLAFFVLVVIGIEATRLWRIEHHEEVRVPVAPFLWALPLLGLTVAQFLHATTLTVAGTAFGDTGAREWPAWVGLAYGVAIVAITLVAIGVDLVDRATDHPTVDSARVAA